MALAEVREWSGGGRYPQPGESFGRYQIDRRLGHGAMGVVYAATQTELGRTVALKVLAPDLADAEEYQHRFTREAEALAQVDSPHIVQIFEAGTLGDWQYLVMQYVPGGDLRQLIEQGALEPLTALEIVSDVASGLEDAHSVGVLHRDVKPSNILLRPLAKGGYHAYVADLGIAQAIGTDVTRTRGVIGSPAYMPPERHNGEEATVQGDIYSLGCVLYAALTGRTPYEGTDVKMAIAHMNEPVPQLEPAADRSPGVTARLNEILATAMGKLPEQRYARVSELGEALAVARAVPKSPRPVRSPVARGADRQPPQVASGPPAGQLPIKDRALAVDERELQVVQARAYEGGGFSSGLHRVQFEGETMLFKEYRSDVTASRAALERIVTWRATLPLADQQWLERRSAFPSRIVLREGEVAGVLMREAPPQFHFTDPRGKQRTRALDFIGVTPLHAQRIAQPYVEVPFRLAVLGRLLEWVNWLHERGVVVGDLNPDNVMFSPEAREPEVFVVDCDSVWLAAESAFPKHDPPSLQCPFGPERSFNRDTDLYKFALLTIRALHGNNALAAGDSKALTTMMPTAQVGRVQGMLHQGKHGTPSAAASIGLARNWRARVGRSGELYGSLDDNQRFVWPPTPVPQPEPRLAAPLAPTTGSAPAKRVVRPLAPLPSATTSSDKKEHSQLVLAAVLLLTVIIVAVAGVLVSTH